MHCALKECTIGVMKMLEMLKKSFRNYIAVSALCIVIGIALVIEPTLLTRLVSYISGGVALAFGVVNIAMYFVKKEDAVVFMIIKGAVLAFAGIFLIVRPDFIPRVISTVFGMYMLVNGVIGLTNATQIKRSGDLEWQAPMISAAVTFFLGLIICANPMLPVKAAMTVLGICLIISGASNLFSSFTAKSKLKAIEKNEQRHRDSIDI